MGIVFLAIVALMNVYVWWRLQGAFLKPDPRIAGIFLLLILLLVSQPVLVWFSGIRATCFGGILTQCSWTWLGIVFWLSCSFLLLDGWGLFLKLMHHWHWLESLPALRPRQEGWIALALLLMGTCWGLWEANAVRLRNLEIPVPQLKKDVRIVFLSDVHLCWAANWYRVRRTLRLVEEAKPDLILSGGDFIDGHDSHVEAMASAFSAMHCSSGKKLAVFGNHDLYVGKKYSRQLHENAGLQVLEDSLVQVGDQLLVFGADEPPHGTGIVWTQPTLPQVGPDQFLLILKHRPDLRDAPMPPRSLMLSGHTHGGQMFPANLLVRWRYHYPTGKLCNLPAGGMLYITPGAGLWGPPFRLCAPAEVVSIILRAQ